MPSCDEIEIALERRAHGDALEADLAASVDAHVAGCERCRAYAAAMTVTSAGLASIAESASASVDWAEVERRIRERSMSRLGHVLVVGAIGLACVLVAGFGIAPPGHLPETLLVMLLVSAVPVAIRITAVYRGTRRSLALTSRDDLFAAERAYLAHRLRVVRSGRWVALAVVVGVLATAVAEPRLSARLGYVVLGLFVAVVWIRTVRVSLPELERAAAELDTER
jgi:predicted anti-sigma-YlaC factor YlaD